MGLIKYIECENERDKWWKGRKAYQTAREYAANLSAFYDGHLNTMGAGVGVKNADKTIQVVMAGVALANTDYFNAMKWLKDERDDLYDPSYNDMLRVAFTSEFQRGRMSDLVSLLSGRNFETREFEEEIAAKTFERMKQSSLRFMNETNFKRFVMIIRSAGFISPDLIRSQNALNFAYIIYLKLRDDNDLSQAEISRLVSRWFVYSVLTGRYSSGAPDGTMDFDIKQISNRPFKEYLESVEKAELSDSFWNFGLTQRLDTSVASSPLFHVFQASMVKGQDKGFLSRDITVADII
jgi:hypothetical protein